ncbi:MAG: hypothetical protein ACP5XB_19010 [Isosphaeraceae bacterium]
MRIIAKKTLSRFWESRRTEPESVIAERDLSTWYKMAENAD